MGPNLILWTGQKHSGKTTAVSRVAERAQAEGFSVAGLLSPAVYEGGELVGFGGVDLASGRRVALASQMVRGGSEKRLSFTEEGLELGRRALSLSAVKSAELVIVDEFGPLELRGKGWRREVDTLLGSAAGVVTLVVRDQLVEQVDKLYKDCAGVKLAAGEKGSINEVMGILRRRRFAK